RRLWRGGRQRKHELTKIYEFTSTFGGGYGTNRPRKARQSAPDLCEYPLSDPALGRPRCGGVRRGGSLATAGRRQPVDQGAFVVPDRPAGRPGIFVKDTRMKTNGLTARILKVLRDGYFDISPD